jgi:molybdopterin/thiamine biosynthesis adenylyltransferase
MKMNNEMKIGVIGCGGTGSYLIPILTKLASDCEIHVWDGDKLESRNLDRQLFTPSMIGKYKAQALAQIHKFVPHNKYVTSYRELSGMDFLFACPDNMRARMHVLKACDEYNIPAVICGNEYESASASYYHPRYEGTEIDYRIRYPESIQMAIEGVGDPTLSCTGEAVEAHPQLPLANSMSASFGVGLFYCWTQKAPAIWDCDEYLELLPIEYTWTATATQTKSIKHIKKENNNG